MLLKHGKHFLPLRCDHSYHRGRCSPHAEDIKHNSSLFGEHSPNVGNGALVGKSFRWTEKGVVRVRLIVASINVDCIVVRIDAIGEEFNTVAYVDALMRRRLEMKPTSSDVSNSRLDVD